MFHNLARLLRHRGLIQSLVARELKARYRGSVLGFFWSFFNPLLLLLVYSFIFKYVMPAKAEGARPDPRGSGQRWESERNRRPQATEVSPGV